MGKYICFILMFVCFMLFDNIASAQITWTTGTYTDNADISKKLSASGATSLTVTVVGETKKDYDFVYIYDSSGIEIKKLSGSINETFTVSGSSITARLISDKSTTASGVAVSVASASSMSVETGLPKADYDSGWLYLVKGGRYDNQAHNLGVLPRLAIIWCATDKTGTNMKMGDYFSEWNGASNVSYGAKISKFTTTYYYIVGGDGGIMGKVYQNAYIRVFMWK